MTSLAAARPPPVRGFGAQNLLCGKLAKIVATVKNYRAQGIIRRLALHLGLHLPAAHRSRSFIRRWRDFNLGGSLGGGVHARGLRQSPVIIGQARVGFEDGLVGLEMAVQSGSEVGFGQVLIAIALLEREGVCAWSGHPVGW